MFTPISNYFQHLENGYLFDEVPMAKAAIGLHRFNRSYTGACLRIRRSSDNTQQDIGFYNDVFDVAAFIAFVGAGSGFIVRAYDQTGNGNDFVQNTTIYQPELKLNVVNGFPAMLYVMTNGGQALSCASGIGKPGAYTVMATFKPLDITIRQTICGSSNSGGSNKNIWGIISHMRAVDGYGVNGTQIYNHGDGVLYYSAGSANTQIQANKWYNSSDTYVGGYNGHTLRRNRQALSINQVVSQAATNSGTEYPFYFGTMFPGDMTTGLYAYMANLVVWDSAMTTTDLIKAERETGFLYGV